ncbi:hypothetical protein SO802_006814 [Lithocarpus litseifolius]|uniref:DUF4283 domain-containing protein n=1 Tax=Lithocarpus litseifolius TaxID=425828 RepID=A0AAW2DSL0_9ROSI
MAEELEVLWRKLSFTEEEGEGVELGSSSTRAAKEVDLFLVEFGDGKDKRKDLDMSQWSFEKQLVIIQEFEGEQTPKEMELKWSPFWIHIFNLPLISRTKEMGWAIGSSLGAVMEVDVPDSRVH